ncbi:E3 ubiquitin/ISG15 ligase TRIM25-like isoform X2 [Pseudophryne corroboree]|uniref:E3 ubiquitin/ISG15 ligase TRIM25-like isoform X2 n=1 Tax=Pseudophryne corroboree TaxID=495146 RepID=UPI003081E28B
MASADLRQELDCSICLSIYTDPVTLRCGHNFCRICIERVLDTQEGAGAYTCPECRAVCQERPVLQRNITLCNIVESFLSTRPDQEETGIFCTYCVDSPVPAAKSCLLCEASLCDKHLTAHSKSAEHVLCDPTTALGNRKCSVHKKVLEYYCTEDAACICVSCCLIGEHRGHQMESLDEASEKKKEKLMNVLQKLTTKKTEAEKILQSLQERRREYRGRAASVTERVTALFRDIRQQQEDLEIRVLNEISRQEESVSLFVTDQIRRLENMKDELSGKMRHIEELCNMSDPVTVLQEPDMGDFCDINIRKRPYTQVHRAGDLDVGLISETLHILSDTTKRINTSIFVPEATDIVLDVTTASNNIHILGDRKTASVSPYQNRPITAEIFRSYPQIRGLIRHQCVFCHLQLYANAAKQTLPWCISKCARTEVPTVGFCRGWIHAWCVFRCHHPSRHQYLQQSHKIHLSASDYPPLYNLLLAAQELPIPFLYSSLSLCVISHPSVTPYPHPGKPHTLPIQFLVPMCD